MAVAAGVAGGSLLTLAAVGLALMGMASVGRVNRARPHTPQWEHRRLRVPNPIYIISPRLGGLRLALCVGELYLVNYGVALRYNTVSLTVL